MQPYVASIFEIFKAGNGPSSTHSIGPQRAAKWFLQMLEARPDHVRVTLYGSLAATGRGHFTDRSLREGLGDIRHEIVWDVQTAALSHPNTMRFEAYDRKAHLLREWTVYSVGGGNLVDAHGLTGEKEAKRYPARDITSTISFCQDRDLNFWQYVERQEEDLWPRLGAIWDTMKDSIRRGLESREEVLPGSLKLPRRARVTYEQARVLDSPHLDIAYLSAFALAVAEENASGNVIVTAPSCGAAGVVPGLLFYYETIQGTLRDEILKALATAGLFGAVIRANASISGAEVGCQGEIGSACSMAAAAGSQLLGGTMRQIEYAAEMGMEHHLGLTCDPVEGYVQIPCIERNMTACLRTFECAAFSKLTDGRHLVSFDDAVEVMYRTGHDLQSAYRETARGGLASLWRKRVAREESKTPESAPQRSKC
ncbi:MAG: L-serine ammonia-lyase, iron-sulfur-dependent, subunit alpha [Verrucomicrobiota bacterium]